MIGCMDIRTPSRGTAFVLAVLFGLLMPWVACAARADDDQDLIEDPAAAGRVRQEAQALDLASNFDANLFEQVNGLVLRGGVRLRRPSPTGITEPPRESPALVRLRQRGQEQLARVERSSPLSADQRARLQLALESDARRIAAEIDATRARYAAAMVRLDEPAGQRLWQEFQQDIQRCRTQLQQAFGTDSLFSALLSEMLDERQQADLAREAQARRAFRWRAIVAAELVRMDNLLGLDQAQHAVIERLLVAAEPRLVLDGAPGRPEDHAKKMLVYHQLSRVDSAPIREQLSERQWQAVAMMMNQGKAMKSWLDQQGLVEPER
jgi:hypothetical protein